MPQCTAKGNGEDGNQKVFAIQQSDDSDPENAKRHPLHHTVADPFGQAFFQKNPDQRIGNNYDSVNNTTV